MSSHPGFSGEEMSSPPGFSGAGVARSVVCLADHYLLFLLTLYCLSFKLRLLVTLLFKLFLLDLFTAPWKQDNYNTKSPVILVEANMFSFLTVWLNKDIADGNPVIKRGGIGMQYKRGRLWYNLPV